MKPETALFLAAAQECLSDASVILAANVPRQAARIAYYAQFHAAQALIFERINRTAKTHGGVNRMFRNIAKSEATLPPDFAAQLSRAYNYKEHTDYNTAGLNAITATLAADAIATAEIFVNDIRRAIAQPPP